MPNTDMEFEYNNICQSQIIDSRRISPAGTDEVRAIDLRIDEPAFRYHEGQTIGVLVPGPNAFGSKPHHRYYSIANARSDQSGDVVTLQLIVRRCFYIDEISGEQYPGIASNYLCDAKPGDSVSLTGPYKNVFHIPQDAQSNLLMIGTGTGIAPFRAFIQRIYRQQQTWQGKVRLFYGDKSGLDLHYLNDVDKDLASYYTEETFQAFQSVTNRYLSSANEELEQTLKDNLDEVWALLQDPGTFVFVAGRRKISGSLDKTLSERAGSPAVWETLKQKLQDEKRWSELLY